MKRLAALPPLAGRTRLAALAAFAALVAGVAAWQIVHRGLGVGIAAQPPAGLGAAPAASLAPQVYAVGPRNPFDTNPAHWAAELPDNAAAKADAAPAAPASSAAGILQLPGLTVAVTGSGLVRTGQAMLGGRFKGIDGEHYIIETDAGEAQRVPIARPPRPTLESLNRARKRPQENQ